MTTCSDLQDLIPAYALNAVDDADRRRIQEHLPNCPDCSQQVAEYMPVVEMLPYAAPQVEPPAELKYRVLAAFPAVARPPAAPLVDRVLARFDWVRALFRSPAYSLAALVLVVAVAIWSLTLQNQLSQQAVELAHQRDVLTLMAYADGGPLRLQGTDVAAGAVGRLYGTSDERTFVVITTDMPKLPANQVYQLWLIDSVGKRTSGGTFTVDDEGRGWMYVRAPQNLGQYRSVGITVEPAGGSPGPTGAKMLGGNL